MRRFGDKSSLYMKNVKTGKHRYLDIKNKQNLNKIVEITQNMKESREEAFWFERKISLI